MQPPADAIGERSSRGVRQLALCLAASAVVLAGCAPTPPAVAFHAAGNPERLADWGVLAVRAGRLVLAPGVETYELNTPLFSDHAHKLRTLWLPPGKSARYTATGPFDFPVGTIVAKTFYYPRHGDGSPAEVSFTATAVSGAATGDLALAAVRLVETRLLVRREEGWVALPYVWNEAQDEAVLARTGETVPLMGRTVPGEPAQPFDYQVPDVNQCAGCHATDARRPALHPIGLAARHLNRVHDYPAGPENQLGRLVRLGWLTDAPLLTEIPRAARWDDVSAPLADRARAYLDINCAHCHQPHGPADTSGLRLDAAAPSGAAIGLCKPPVAAGQGTGDRRFGIVPGHPEQSILLYRMESSDPGAMMPEVGRSLVHVAGNRLIADWIASLPGDCR